MGLRIVLPTSDPSGERHDHQGQDSTAQAEPAGAGQRDEQRLQGVPDHGLLAPAVLRDPQELPDLRGGRLDRPAAGRKGAAPQPGVRRSGDGDPGARAGPSHPRRPPGRPGAVAQGHPRVFRRGAGRVVAPCAADQAGTAAQAGEDHRRAQDRALRRAGPPAGALLAGVPRAPHRDPATPAT